MADQPQLDWNAAEVRETVEGVQEGSEDNVRFALDGALQEATAHHAQDGSKESDEDEESEGGADSEGDDTDRRMTERFRDSAD